MKLFKIFFIFFLLVLVSISCSTRKDTVISRNYNALKTNYNVLYNGQLAYNEGIKTLSEKHEDNFWKRLPIEPITFDHKEIEAPKFNNSEKGNNKSDENQTPFDRAEEKSVKAIQKHSMNIGGYEKNSKTDEAYLLLGKSRYYTQRFIPAIEAFNYIIANYPKADLHYETRVWRAKANTRLGNEERGIETLNLLLKVLDKNEKVSKRVQEEAYTAMAMAYAQTDTIQKLIENLKLASQTFINKEQSARNMFVLGQVYTELNRKDSARMIFKALADKRQAPRKYRVHANIELAKNSETDTSSVALMKRFKKLIKNSDNYAYLDQLHYQVGVLEENNGDIEAAILSYTKSVTSKNAGDYQKTHTYERLGNINFKQQKYLQAGAYYDTILQISSGKYDDEKRIRNIKRKNKNLTTHRKYDSIITKNDSILLLVNMSQTERTTFFERHIAKIKKQDEEKRQQLLNAKNFGNQFGNSIGFDTNKNAGKWYFYNLQSINFGKGEFQRLWGTRPLEDNWRLSDKKSIESIATEKEIVDNPKYQINTYLEAIPFDIKEIETLTEYRDNALYQLSLLYKEQFKNNTLALQNLKRFQAINTNEKMNLQVQYHLYELYTTEGNETLANKAKEYILNNYPDSVYAQTIQNPDKKAVTKEHNIDESQKIYKYVYSLYNQHNYQKAVSEIDSFQHEIVNNSKLIPKLALIKALAIGKFKSKEEYLKELKYVAVRFSNKEEGKKAIEIIKLLE